MGAMASQITSLTIVYSSVYSGADQRKKKSKLRVTGLCAGNSPVTGEFPAQMASNVEKFSIWWRHHDNLCQKLDDVSASSMRKRRLISNTNIATALVILLHPRK